MPGLMSGDWKRSTVSGPQRLQLDAWTAPDLAATAPAPDSTPTSSWPFTPGAGRRIVSAFLKVRSDWRPAHWCRGKDEHADHKHLRRLDVGDQRRSARGVGNHRPTERSR